MDWSGRVTLIGEWTTVDKATWARGPWDNEPDKIHWIDDATDLDCLMSRGPGGHWCGYVAVPPTHPWFGKAYSACLQGCEKEWCYEHSAENEISVHGGLTFADACAESDDPAVGICHVAQPGRPDHVWWFGFDCAHSQDRSPAREARYRGMFREPEGYTVYRDRAYVEAEVRRLAEQLARVASSVGT